MAVNKRGRRDAEMVQGHLLHNQQPDVVSKETDLGSDLRIVANCAIEAGKKVCRDSETVDTGFMKCKEGADRRFRICTRGQHLTPLPGRGW